MVQHALSSSSQPLSNGTRTSHPPPSSSFLLFPPPSSSFLLLPPPSSSFLLLATAPKVCASTRNVSAGASVASSSPDLRWNDPTFRLYTHGLPIILYDARVLKPRVIILGAKLPRLHNASKPIHNASKDCSHKSENDDETD